MKMRAPPILALGLLAVRCGGESQPGTAAPPNLGVALTARVVEGQCMGLGAGTQAQAGATLQTAPTERAKVELSDGSVVILDHETKLVLEAAPRQVRLESGQAVLDVAHVEGAPPLKVKLLRSEGEAIVTGTKLSVREDEGRALVDVSRGEVQLSCPRGAEVVRPGEQGVMVPGSAPTVSAAPDLGAAIAWSESGANDEEAGVGSLRARNPRTPNANEEPLRLAEHRVSVRIVGPIARTEIEQTFANDTNQELEGTYRFPLPSGARISSMAIDVGGTYREGRFVDRSTGERIWRGVIKNARLGGHLGRVNTDDILFTPGPWRDPALLAWEAGNRFSVRIFPIHANSTRKVRLSYVETLASTGSGRRYVYPLPQGQWGSIGRSVADRVHVDVRVTGHDTAKPLLVRGLDLAQADEGAVRVLTTDSERFVPAGNLVVEMAEPGQAPIRTATYRDGADLFAVVAIRPELPRAQSARAIEHVILLDSSYGSTGEMWRREVAVAQSLVKEMAPEDRVTVLTCDVGCRPVGAPSQVPSGALVTALGDALFRVEPGGTTDLVRAVEEAARMVGSAAGGRTASLVYIGDGVATVGVRDAGRIAELASHAVSQSNATLSTIAVGTTCDARGLAELSRRTGGVAVEYAPGDDAPSLALRLLGRLRGATLEDARVQIPGGATEVAPAVLPAIHAGEEVWIGAKIPAASRGDVVLSGAIDGRPFEARFPVSFEDQTGGATAFVPALWAEKRAFDLAAAGDVNREEVVALGTRYGLVTPFTSLLVVDSDALAERLGLGQRTNAPQFTGELDDEAKPDEEGESGGAQESMDAPIARPAAPVQTTPAPDRRAEGQAGRSGGGASASEAARGPAPTGAVAAPTAPPPAAEPAPPPLQQPTAGEEEADTATPAGGTRERAARSAPGHGGAVGGMGDNLFDPDGGGGGWSPWRGRVLRPVRVPHLSAARPGRQGLAGASQAVLQGVAELHAKVAAEPDKRASHRDLAKLLARVGEIAEGTQVVRGWLARDAMDVEALTFLSDFEARAGDRDRSVRTLASVVEVQPGDKASHQRMAQIYERAGRALDACAHRVTLAALSPTDDAAAAAATRCQTTEELPAPDAIRGNLVIGARFDGGVDLDVNVVYRDGTRVSWMGGKRNVRAAEATSTSGERLAIGFVPVGNYTIEVARAAGASGPAVSGSLEIRVLGERRSTEFRLESGQARVAVATLRVATEFR